MRWTESGQLTQIKPGSIPDSPARRRRSSLLVPAAVAVSVAAALAGIWSLAGRKLGEAALAEAGLAGFLAGLGFIIVGRKRTGPASTQRALENMQARVGDIVESAMDAIISVDGDHRVVEFNAAAERVFLMPAAKVLGQPLDMLMPARFRLAHDGHIDRFAFTGVATPEMGTKSALFGLRADGEEFPIEVAISQHLENGSKRFTVTLRDVSHRRNTEVAQASIAARLHGIVDSAMDAIITVDEHQHIVLFNTAAEEVFLCPRHEAVGASLSWFIPERFRASHPELMERFAAAGVESRRMGAARVVTGVRRNGDEFPIEASISHTTEGGQRFFTVILRDVTERVRSEEALLRSKQEIQSLALAASAAREQEKRRIARELHDELGQALTALKMDVGALRESIDGSNQAAARKLDSMRELLDATVAATRRISADLRPMMLDDLGLTAAADWLTQNFAERTGVPCEFALEESADFDLPDPYSTAIFRVLQESLTNVAKHAAATQVEVALERERSEVILTVRDNGRGMAAGSGHKPASFGLVGLRERAYLLGGTITINSAPDQGTVVEFRVPLTEPGMAKP